MSDQAFYGRVDGDGKLELEDRARFRSYLAEHCAGTFVEVTVWTIHHPRRSEALQYYFKSVVQPLSDILGTPMPEMHTMLKSMFLRIENDPKTGAVRARHLPKDRKLFWTYVENCIEFATVEHGLTIAPRPTVRVRHEAPSTEPAHETYRSRP